MRNIGIFWVLILTTLGCSAVKNLAVETDIERTLKQSPVFSNQFTGFSLYDIEVQRFIAGYNDTKKFTPASNVKILTMYSTLKSFEDSIPGLLYTKSNDTLFVQPTGDPTFLDNRFEKQPILEFLVNQNSQLAIDWPRTEIRPFGTGWAWDDYQYDFQAQRNWWPIYRNSVTIIRTSDTLTVTPEFFKDFVEVSNIEPYGDHVNRELKYNLFQVVLPEDTSSIEKLIPFEWSQELLTSLLADTLKSTISTGRTTLSYDTLNSQHVDHVLSLMMKVSDNFIAEQLLILSAWKNGYSSIDPFIKHARLIWLSDLNDFVWVDGSGLSRYNLISPVDQVRLVKKSVDEFGLERIKNILAVGGESGTIKDWYAAEEPYIHAKTGTLSNNHNLTGLLKTKSGKWMIFSFMNNNFTIPVDKVKAEMQMLLEGIRDTY